MLNIVEIDIVIRYRVDIESANPVCRTDANEKKQKVRSEKCAVRRLLDLSRTGRLQTYGQCSKVVNPAGSVFKAEVHSNPMDCPELSNPFWLSLRQ